MINRTVIAIALAIFLSSVSGLVGWKLRDADYQRHLKADARAALKASEGARATEAKNEETATDIGRQVEEAKTEVQIVTRTLIKEIPIHVTAQADAHCVVPLGFVRLHDAAATGDPAPSYATGESPDQASGTDLSTVAGTVIDNYGYTRELEAQVNGWIDWYERVKADWPVK